MQTIINGTSASELNFNRRTDVIAAGRLSIFNDRVKNQQVLVTREGARPIDLGAGELEIQLEAGENGKTRVTYYQDLNDHEAPLKNLTLVLEANGNSNPQKIELSFDKSLRIADDAATNTLAAKKIIPNSFQTEVRIPPGIYSVRAIEANTQEIEKPLVISFAAGGRNGAYRELLKQLSQDPLKKAG